MLDRCQLHQLGQAAAVVRAGQPSCVVIQESHTQALGCLTAAVLPCELVKYLCQLYTKGSVVAQVGQCAISAMRPPVPKPQTHPQAMCAMCYTSRR